MSVLNQTFYGDDMSSNETFLIGSPNATDSNKIKGWLYKHENLRFKYGVEGIATACIGVFGVIGNIFTLLTLYRQRPRTSTVVYLLSLAATDLIFLLSQTSHWSLRSIYDSEWTRSVAKFTYQIHYINLLLNIWLVVCVSVDRYIAVCHPHRMATMCNVGRAKLVVGLIAFLAVVYNLPRFGEIIEVVRTPAKVDKLYILIYKVWMYCGFYAVAPLILLLVLNCFIIIAMHRRHQMKLRLTSKGSSTSTVSKKKVRGDTHVNVICVAVVMLFLVCQLPFILATIIWAILYQGQILTTNANTSNHDWLIDLNSVAIMSATINSATNFLLYCAFSSGFRKSFLEVIHFRTRDKNRGWTASTRMKPDKSKNNLFAQVDFSPVTKTGPKANWNQAPSTQVDSDETRKSSDAINEGPETLATDPSTKMAASGDDGETTRKATAVTMELNNGSAVDL